MLKNITNINIYVDTLESILAGLPNETISDRIRYQCEEAIGRVAYDVAREFYENDALAEKIENATIDELFPYFIWNREDITIDWAEQADMDDAGTTALLIPLSFDDESYLRDTHK